MSFDSLADGGTLSVDDSRTVTQTETPTEAQHANLSDTRPVPAADDITRFFWDAAGENRLLLQRCTACQRFQYPPDVVCTFCQCEELAPTEVSGRGTLYSVVVVDRAFHPGFVPHLPYMLALIELDEQPALRILTNVVDATEEELEIGMAMRVTFETRGEVTLPQFTPARSDG